MDREVNIPAFPLDGNTWVVVKPDGTPLHNGSRVADFRGSTTTFRYPSRAPSGNSTGRVVTDQGEYFPGVYSLKIMLARDWLATTSI